MARKKREPIMWPHWYYGPDGESGVFNSAEEVPAGWAPTPGGKPYEQPKSTTLDREDLVRQLEAVGVVINPVWGNAHLKRILDGDVSPTG